MTDNSQPDVLTAHVAVLEAPRRLLFKSEPIDTAALAPDELLCQTECTVISPGTEIAAYVGAPPLRPGVAYPRVLGYCNVARVLRHGESVRGVSTGDRVLTFGSHRTHLVIRQGDVLALVPPDMASANAACAYLFHLGYSAVLEANVRLGSIVVVVGLGVLGLASVAAASMAGARVLAISDHAHLQRLAGELGAEGCYARTEFAQLLAKLPPGKADVVVTTSNSWADWPLALQCAGMRASIAVLGFPGRQEISIPFNPFDTQHFYVRQLRIFAAGVMPEHADSRGFLPFNERANLGRILQWIQAGRLRPGLLLSGAFHWRQLESAYANLIARKDSPVTYLLRWDDAG